MKTLTIIIFLLSYSLIGSEFTYQKEEVLERHYERIKDKLPLMMDSWDPPNNEPECVSFGVVSVVDGLPVNKSESIRLSSWNLREKHNDYCGGSPYTSPNITNIDFYLVNGRETMRFEKWCFTDSGDGKEYMPIMILVDDSFTGGCPEYVEGFNHLTGEWNKK